MKTNPKKEREVYSFAEYQRRFPPPPPQQDDRPYEDPSELGAKMAEESLARIRKQANNNNR
jgi:hypothetical protein